MNSETERLAKDVEKELSALRAKVKKKKNLEALKSYRELASSLD